MSFRITLWRTRTRLLSTSTLLMPSLLKPRTGATKPIAVAFALIGLCLYLEKNYTGKQVQLTHMALGRKKREWPKFDLPESRGEIMVGDVLSEPAGAMRDAKIREWCASVWKAYSGSREKVLELISRFLHDS